MRNFCLAILLLLAHQLFAQSKEEASVKACIDQLFTAMRTGDSSLLAECFSPTALLQTIVSHQDGSTEVKTEPVQLFVSSVGKPHKEVYDERISYGSILVDDNLASVWTPYQFYLGEKFSHCGVNAFQLVKLNGRWKIQYIIDTRRKGDCL
ncbi:MAG: nuclear transport factor 2 family protein [Bacteroidetes bacterium]|nr:nuclear transport factor 2 family protein [Bacteroidota bacterium]